jgi:hypothetical protein
MIGAIKEAIDLKWDAPYRFATSAIALLIIGSRGQRPLEAAAAVVDWLGVRAWATWCIDADQWMLDHSVDGAAVVLIFVVYGATLAALQGGVLPTRAAGTFWLVAALAMYATAPAGWIIAAVAGGILSRAIHAGHGVRWETGTMVALNLAFAAVYMPMVVLLWAFAKSDIPPRAAT